MSYNGIHTAVASRRIELAIIAEYGGDVSGDLYSDIARIVKDALAQARDDGERYGALKRQAEIAASLAADGATERRQATPGAHGGVSLADLAFMGELAASNAKRSSSAHSGA